MAKFIDRAALATLLGLSAGMIAGCSPSNDGQWQVCTDNSGRRVPDANCSTNTGHTGGAHGGGSWRYFSGDDPAPAVGQSVSGGSRTPLAGEAHAAPVEGISRGGFGGHGEGGGGEGGGGHGGAGE
ncbi:MAG: hypothetical protein KGL44_09030 [Sphingomonadales bacterium]|nr:hypothetical protein [Sphingomonadales bacterium]